MDPEDVPRDEFREWAERNGYEIREVPDSDDLLAVGQGGYLTIRLTKYGNVNLELRTFLGGENGEISFGEKQMTVVDERGEEHRVSPGRFPTP